ncbi:MAG: hypothetical protein QOI84_93 [Solirubrobacterales bacterium]|nr:hypothetical protein [Solirubrobacterales bacterium]
MVFAIGTLADAEVIQHGNLRVRFEGRMTPRSLPRTGTAPIAVSVGGTIKSTDGAVPPQLRRVVIGINRHGRIDATGLPVCRIAQIQPATTRDALRACGRSLVGEGSFSSKTILPEQAPFPSDGTVYAFNGIFRGGPAILVHIYGTKPAPISFTLPFRIRRGSGTFATTLYASLPHFTGKWGYVTGLRMTLRRRYSYRGRSRSYISAGCPAPAGFPGAVFPLARVRYRFADGRQLSSTLIRACSVRRQAPPSNLGGPAGRPR